jgi:hypothetical protein
MKIQVNASSNIVVTALGRWCYSGNSGAHAITIYDNGCALIATATVNLSGQTPGSYVMCVMPRK